MIKKILLTLTIVAFTGAGIAIASKAASSARPCKGANFPDGYRHRYRAAELAAGVSAGRHTHPGLEIGYVLEGEVDLLVDGQPARHLKAGDSWQIPAGTPHDAKVSATRR